MRMKKLLSFLLVLTLLFGCVSLFSGCARRVTYENEEDYSVGAFETDEEIHTVEIYWDGRGVSVSAAFRDKIRAQEDYENADAKAMRYAISDGVLKIYPCASGKSVEKLAKTLFLELPMEIVDGLRSLKIETAGRTKVNLQMMKAEKLTVIAKDGNVSIDGALSRVFVETKTGNFDIKSATITELDFKSLTGNANLNLHLQGFLAVMREEEGTFRTDYDVSENGTLFSYGSQEAFLAFTTEGTVNLKDYDIAQ